MRNKRSIELDARIVRAYLRNPEAYDITYADQCRKLALRFHVPIGRVAAALLAHDRAYDALDALGEAN
jgi:hypothetical protein